jgi:protein-tyrosine phosphatase
MALAQLYGPIPGLDADPVLPNLWQGSYPKPGTYPFDLIVLAAAEYQPAAEKFPGARVLHVPLRDVYLKDVTREQLPRAIKAAEVVAAYVRAGKRVLVTCAAGWNRSGLINALALRRLGYSADDAIVLIRKARGKHALGNEVFQRMVREFVPLPSSVVVQPNRGLVPSHGVTPSRNTPARAFIGSFVIVAAIATGGLLIYRLSRAPAPPGSRRASA